jgi:hypothetical protein
MRLTKQYKKVYDEYKDIKDQQKLIDKKVQEELEELKKEVMKKYNRKLSALEKKEEKLKKELQSYEEELLNLHGKVKQKTLLDKFDDNTKLYVNVDEKFKVSVPKLRDAIIKYPTIANYCSISGTLLKSVIVDMNSNPEDPKIQYLKDIGKLEQKRKIQLDNK